MPPSKMEPAVKDVDLLTEPFRSEVRGLEALLGKGRPLPFVIIETRRSVKRQGELMHAGRSKTNLGPHCFGLAFDVMLDVKHDYWRIEGGDRPLKALDGGPAAWDTGFEMLPGASGVRLARPTCAKAWRLFGATVEGLGFTWGGRNDGAWASPFDGNEFGWDCGHTQAADWRATVKRLGLTAS